MPKKRVVGGDQAVRYRSLGSLLEGDGGTVLLGEIYLRDKAIQRDYARHVTSLERYPFWSVGETGTYRPDQGLWAPQRKAVALVLAYLACQRREAHDEGKLRESALVKMPTGTGKTGVIATLACCAQGVRRTIVLTPRKALVEQMISDLAWRFWKRFGYCYVDHEMRPRAELEGKVLHTLEQGRKRPVEILRNEGYGRIWAHRDSPRQIIVGTFNALHAVLGLKPPAHRSMYGRAAPEAAAVLEDCVLEPDATGGADNFRALLRDTDLLIVDEGHYEPAYTWAQCVNNINAPTVIFSATPYRNDYKYFKMHGNFAFNLDFEEAVENRLIRRVAVGANPSSREASRRDGSVTEFVRFVRDRCKHYPILPEGRLAKCIVHGATYETLKRLQCEFYRQDATQRAVLIHDAHSGPSDDLDGDLRKLGPRATADLTPFRFQHVSDASNPNGVGIQARIWLHQFKLLEGIDNADFIEVFLFDGFRNARQLVQQIGRALRYTDPRRRRVETASIFGSQRPFDALAGPETIDAVTRRQWLDYLEYERYAAQEPQRAFTAETQLLALLKKTAPDSQYFAGAFRKGFFTDENASMAEYTVPRRAVVCHYEDPTIRSELDKDAKEHSSKSAPREPEISDEVLDHLVTESIQAFQLEERFDIRIVPPPKGAKGYEDVRLVRYLAWDNSKLLRRHSLPEWRLGLMAIVRANPFVFLIDTEGVCVDFDRLGLFSPSPEEMKRLFSEKELDGRGHPRRDRIRIVEASAVGLDLSEISIRSMTIRKRNLGDGYFDLAEASQAPSSLHGIALLGERTTRRQLSIRRGRVVDPTTRHVTLKDYAEWTHLVAQALADNSVAPHPFFNRFAVEVQPPSPNDGEAHSLLLDIWELLNPDDAKLEEKEWDPQVREELLSYDTCIEAVDVSEGDGDPDLVFSFGDRFEIRATYTLRKTIPPRGRYTLSCKQLDEAIRSPTEEPGTSEASTFGSDTHRPASLVSLINQRQCFRIIPADQDVVYANGVFFKPSIDWNAVRNDAKGNLLDVITIAPSLQGVVSEKGESGVTSKSWRTKSQFGVILSAFSSARADRDDPMWSEIAACDLVICDDGPAEIGDFLCLNEKQKTVRLVHAKASGGSAGVSVTNLQVVGRQASASLAFVGSTRAPLPYPSYWKKDLVIRNRKNKSVIQSLQRVQSRSRTSASDAHRQIVAALRDPTYRREVWIVTAGLLSKKKAVDELGAETRCRGALQFAYYLADLRTAFGRAGVGLRIFTGE